MVKLIMDYANKNNIILYINDQETKGNYPLLFAVDNDNIEMIKLLIDYANQKSIILKINGKESKYHYYPLYNAVANNNLEIVQLLMDYADQKNIIITMDNNKNGNNPFSWAVALNNIKMVRVLLDYANKNNIRLEMKENFLDNIILEYHKEKKQCINNISEIKTEIIRLLDVNRKNNLLNILFKVHGTNKSPLLKRFEEISITAQDSLNSNSNNNSLEKNNNSNSKLTSPKSTSIESKINEHGDLAVVLYDFNGFNTDELNLHKDEYIVVTNWTIKEGWAYGYKKNDPHKKGIFPAPLVRKGLFLNFLNIYVLNFNNIYYRKYTI